MNWLWRTLIMALGIYVVSAGLGLIEAESGLAVLVGGFLLAALNAWLKPFLLIVTLPLNLVTLGLLTVFLNALLLALAAWLTPGLATVSFWRTVAAALLISLVSLVVNAFVNPERSL